MNEYNMIDSVVPGSIAEEIGLKPGDRLVKINGNRVMDILQYRYFCACELLELEILKTNGETQLIEIEKDEYEDLGINFKFQLMSEAKSCHNKCIFCFIDQLPKGMRETLYFKDDDSRLSFLQGNYVTLTNMSEEEIKNIAKLRISPINISVHTTDGELRKKMMKNKNADKVMDIMRMFAKNGIIMNCQIVLCKGINDGAALDKSIADLFSLYPHVASVSVVPAGLSDHREGLFELELFTKDDAAAVIKQVHQHQEKMLNICKSRLVYLADEFYLKAELPIPPYEAYEDFPQIENGVGLIASMRDEFELAIDTAENPEKPRCVSIATGLAAYGFIKEISQKLCDRFENININVYAVKNRVFGENITVAGLLCGRDIIDALKDKPLGDELFITSSMLRSGEEVFLDDVTLDDMCDALNIKVTPIDNDGGEFIDKILGEEI